MEIQVFSIGKIKQDFVRQAESEYVPRIKQYSKISFTELEFPKYSALPEKDRREKETQAVLERVKPGSSLIALDEDGKKLTSREFAAMIEKKLNSGVSSFSFAIGGAYGWDKGLIKEKAAAVISLSPLTFTYQMTRMILVEQIYRALSIINHQPYHKS